jgi:hypothetical protein
MAGVTFETETASDCRTAMRVLAIVFVVAVAVWASTGGLERMLGEIPTALLRNVL